MHLWTESELSLTLAETELVREGKLENDASEASTDATSLAIEFKAASREFSAPDALALALAILLTDASASLRSRLVSLFCCFFPDLNLLCEDEEYGLALKCN